MKIVFLGGLRPFNPKVALRDVVAGVTLASMNIPQVLGYARIAGLPVVTGLYTVLLPILAFAVSRHLVVAADSATAVIFSGSLTSVAAPSSEKYVALAGMVALLTAGILLLAWVFKLGLLTGERCKSRRVVAWVPRALETCHADCEALSCAR
jgi:sulfate permease, SulP family